MDEQTDAERAEDIEALKFYLSSTLLKLEQRTSAMYSIIQSYAEIERAALEQGLNPAEAPAERVKAAHTVMCAVGAIAR